MMDEAMMNRRDELGSPRLKQSGPALCSPWFILAFCVVLSGCKVGPNYTAPQTQMPANWVDVGAESNPATQPALGVSAPVAESVDVQRWWTNFSDATLTSLIEQAAVANLDLVQAEARIRQARAARTIAGAPLYPDLNSSASFTRSHSNSSSSVSRTTNLFRAGFDAAWELDVFGGTRRAVEAADADFQSAIEDRRSVLVSLLAEVATTYFDLRGFQQQLAIAQSNLQAQQNSVDLTRQRFNAGFVGQLDVANAEAQVASTSSRIPTLESSIRQSIYALSVLLAQEPGALLSELSAQGPLPPVPPQVPIGLPSDLLRRRPDVRLAEANLHSATARIGVATADLFPKFSLTGSLGVQGSSLSNLSNTVSSFGPSVTWPIFAGGRIRANIDVQKAVTDERYAAYQQTVLVALQDVENALIAYVKEQQRHASLTDSVRSNRQAVDLATQLYTAGRTDFLNVLSAQGSLFSAEDALSQSDTNVVTDLVALYKALGGGWTELESSDAPARAVE